MRCFDKLKSHFLTNVSKELSLARQTIKSMSFSRLDPCIIFEKKEKRMVYEDALFDSYLLEEIIDTIAEGMDTKSLYYVEIGNVSFMYGQDRKLINEAVQYRYNLEGFIPCMRTKHRVNGTTVYTLLYDTRLKFETINSN
jgi:hypothetical protein